MDEDGRQLALSLIEEVACPAAAAFLEMDEAILVFKKGYLAALDNQGANKTSSAVFAGRSERWAYLTAKEKDPSLSAGDGVRHVLLHFLGQAEDPQNAAACLEHLKANSVVLPPTFRIQRFLDVCVTMDLIQKEGNEKQPLYFLSELEYSAKMERAGALARRAKIIWPLFDAYLRGAEGVEVASMVGWFAPDAYAVAQKRLRSEVSAIWENALRDSIQALVNGRDVVEVQAFMTFGPTSIVKQ